MRSFFAAFVVAAIVGGGLTPFVRRLALRLGAVSLPGGRHVHERSVPRLGGLAILVALFAPLIGLFFVESAIAAHFTSNVPRVIGLFVGGTAMCAVGFVDDTRGLRAVHKLYAQLGVAVLAYACGFRIETVQLPFLGSLAMGVFALPVTVAWIVGIVNAVNLIDGLDGLAAGVVFFASLTNFIVAYVADAPLFCLLMASTMGAVLGFLFHNFNPARIFMGDSGSYFLGYVLATSSLAGGPKATTPVALLVPVLALGVPIFDVMFAMVRRILERRSIFSPDRGHIHHRLLDMGLTHRRAVLIIYAVSLVFATAAIAVYLGRSWQVGAALLVASVVLVGLVRFAGYFEYLRARRRHRTAAFPGEAERIRQAIPTLPALLQTATTSTQVLRAMERFCQDAGLRSFDLLDRTTGTVVHHWNAGNAGARSEEVSVCFSLGEGPQQRPLDLRFAWASELGEVSPLAELLLQVASDLLVAHIAQTPGNLLVVDPVEGQQEAPPTSAVRVSGIQS